MATYDLEQQEQLDQAKHFWQKYGNLVTWVLVLALGAYAAFTGYQYWQSDRALKAAGLFEELDRAVQSRDTAKADRAFADLKDRYAGTTFAEQGALLSASSLVLRGQEEPARAALAWLIDAGKSADLVAVARLRLAGLQLDADKPDEALKTLDAPMPEAFVALQQDRRGDILALKGNQPEAIKAYQAAFKAMDPAIEYRRFIEGKLTVLGQAPAAPDARAAAPTVSVSTP